MAGPWEDFGGNTAVAASPTPAPQDGPWTDFAQASKPWEDFTPPPPSSTPASDQAVAEPNSITGKLGEVWRGIDIKSLPADVGKALVGLIGATESPKAFKQAWDVLHGVPVAQAIPESQTLVGIENKPIEERIKTGFDVATNLGFLKGGEKAVRKAAGTIPAPAEAPPVVGNEQFARVTPVNERAGAAVPADNPAPAQSTILEGATQPEPKPVVPITEENAAQAATDIGGLSYGGVQSWPADSGIPSTLEFTITEPGKETTLSVPPGITPEELIARRDQKLADFAAKEQPTEPAAAQPAQEATVPVMITKRMEADLRARGHTQAEINSMTPQQANDILNPTPVTDTEPHISAIANRFTQERAAKGEIGEIAPGQGVSTIDLTQRGLNMGPEEVNQHISDAMNDAGGDPKLQASAIRGEEARLSKRSHDLSRAAEANPTDINARIAADNAFKDLTDFHNGPVAKLKNNWHAQGMAMQGEVPVDLSTLNGLREAWLKDTGKAPPASVEPTLRKAAERVRKTVAEENGAMKQLGQEIDKATRGRKLPTADEVRTSIRERMGLGPCKV